MLHRARRKPANLATGILSERNLAAATFMCLHRRRAARDRAAIVNYFKLYCGDYSKKTQHLTLAEHGAYVLMLIAYYATERPLPVVPKLYRLCHATSLYEKRAVDSIVTQFWQVTEAGLINVRADQEIIKDQEFMASQRAKAAAGAAARWQKKDAHRDASGDASGDDSGNAPAMPLHSPILRLKSRTAPPTEAPSLDKSLFAEARRIFGTSIGGQINRAIRERGKPFVLEMIEACRGKDPEAARAYLAASMKRRNGGGHDEVVV